MVGTRGVIFSVVQNVGIVGIRGWKMFTDNFIVSESA